MSIRNKIFTGSIIPVIILGICVIISIRGVFERTFQQELEKKGLAIASGISLKATDMILINDKVALHQLLDEIKESNDDISYIFIVDENGMLLIHSFSEGFPVELLKANPIKKGENYRVQPIEAEEDIIDDIAMPIFKGKVGYLHLGVSEKFIKKKLLATTKILTIFLFVALFLCFIITYIIERLITKPIMELIVGVERVSKGDLKHRVRIRSKDEIGKLGIVFNKMLEERNLAEKELTKYQEHLEELVKERTDEVQREIIQRRQKEEELKKYTQELELVNKELDSFTYIVSHDLKEPLRGIESFSQFILEDYQDKLDDKGKDYLKRICVGVSRMKNLVNDLLSLSRISRIRNPYELVDTVKLVNEGIKDLSQIIEERKVEIEIDNELPYIYCDQVKMKEVFYNLISNAIKYNEKAKTEIEIGVKTVEKERVFFIKDNGIGIKKEYFDQIFQIFRRLHGNGEYGGGTGPGLAIVKKIIEEHEGRIWVSSEEGRGSTFFFTIPQRTDGVRP